MFSQMSGMSSFDTPLALADGGSLSLAAEEFSWYTCICSPRGFMSCCFGSSLHVEKVVAIRSRGLVLFRNAAACLLFIKIIVIDILYNTGYLSFGELHGEVRAVMGVDRTEGWRAFAGNSSYCRVEGSPSMELRCDQYTTQRLCMHAPTLSKNSVTETSVFMFSAGAHHHQCSNKSCATDDLGFGYGCDPWLAKQLKECFFIADAEKQMMKLVAQVTQAQCSFSATSYYIVGKLEVTGDHELQHNLCALKGDRPYSPCFITLEKDERKKDIIPISLLLHAVGRTWDMQRNSGKIIRASGITLELYIAFTNFQPWLGIQAPSYIYSVRHIKDSSGEYLSEKILRNVRITSRYTGARVRFRVGGVVGKFDIVPLALRLATFVTFLGLVEHLAIYVAQRWHRGRSYFNLSYEEVFPDDIDFKLVGSVEPEEIVKALENRGLAIGGSRNQQIHRLLMDGWRPGNDSGNDQFNEIELSCIQITTPKT